MVDVTKFHLREFKIIGPSGSVKHSGNPYWTNLPAISSEVAEFLLSKGFSNFSVDINLLRSYPKFGPRKEQEIKFIQSLGEW